MGQLEMGIQIRMAKIARYKMLLVVHGCCLRVKTETFYFYSADTIELN